MEQLEKFESERTFLFTFLGLILVLSSGIFGFFWNDFIETNEKVKELENADVTIDDNHSLKGSLAIDTFFIVFIGVPFFMVFLAGNLLLRRSIFDEVDFKEDMRSVRLWLGFGFFTIFIPFLILILYSLSPNAKEINAKSFFEFCYFIALMCYIIGPLGPALQRFDEKHFQKGKIRKTSASKERSLIDVKLSAERR